MFDHVGLNVKDYAASRAFYEQALAPLGWSVVMAFEEWKAVGFGTADKPDFSSVSTKAVLGAFSS